MKQKKRDKIQSQKIKEDKNRNLKKNWKNRNCEKLELRMLLSLKSCQNQGIQLKSRLELPEIDKIRTRDLNSLGVRHVQKIGWSSLQKNQKIN